MKPLFKIMAILAIAFALTFIVIKVTGLLTLEEIRFWLESAKSINTQVIVVVVVLLLFADLFIAIPTLSAIILSGHFLGYYHGAIAALIGTTLAGLSGYAISYRYGEKLEKLVVKSGKERTELRRSFKQYGVFMILFARAMPILPEVTACMSGINKMKLLKFISAWLVGSVPYVLIASYAGSISTLENPKPAITAAILMTTAIWSAWFIFKFIHKKRRLIK